jgi:hypothetical protein
MEDFMRYRSLIGVAACVCAGLTVAGCSSQGSGSASGSVSGSVGGTPATTSPAATGTPAQSGGTAAGSRPSAPATQPAQASVTCQPASLKIALGAPAGAAGQQQTLAVDLTNAGSAACTMDGFPGVNLIGSALGKQDYTWPLTRASQSYQRVTLQPGGIAHFDIVYLPGTSSDASNGNTDLAVSTLVVTPPNDYSHANVTWSQSVLLQDAATHPGTFITPVVSGA